LVSVSVSLSIIAQKQHQIRYFIAMENHEEQAQDEAWLDTLEKVEEDDPLKCVSHGGPQNNLTPSSDVQPTVVRRGNIVCNLIV
jgi:hypothetical protein